MIGIYKFINKFNRKVYVGQSIDIEGRYKAHLKNKKNPKVLFDKAIKKYGVEGFDFDIIIECPKEALNYWEKFYIKYYCSNNNKYGYNLTDGGNGTGEAWNKGLKMTEEQRKKSGVPKGTIPWNKGAKGLQKAWNKGLTKEIDDRILKGAINLSNSKKGKPQPNLRGEKNGMYGKPSSFKGRKHTEEAKEKNRIAHLKKHIEI